jgi:hypothetical protein
MQAYEGYFENGKFYTAGRALRIPERRRAIVNILDDEIVEVKTKSQRQGEAFERFIAANKDITDEPLDEEWDEIISQGINIDSGMDL